MLYEDIRLAIRGLRREGGHAIAMVVGLAVALSATILIAQFVRHELSYDRHHVYADRVYRVVVNRTTPSETIRSAATPRPLANALVARVPQIETTTRLSRERSGRVLIEREGEAFFEEGLLFADPNVFDVFTIPLHRGDPDRALANPFAIVVTRETAERYFRDDDPLGETLRVRLEGDGDTFNYTVTGVAEDPPETSHFRFDLLASYTDHPNVGAPDDQDNWTGLDVYTYALLKPGTSSAAVESTIGAAVRPAMQEQIEEDLGISFEAFRAAGNRFDYILQPLTDIHLHSSRRYELQPGSSAAMVGLFGVIGIFILLLASINVTHLATARSEARIRTVGIHRLLGAGTARIVRLVLTEMWMTALLAAVLSVGLVQLIAALMPSLGYDTVPWVDAAPTTILAYLAVSPFVVAIVAGIAPAAYLSRFGLMPSLRGRGGEAARQMAFFRRGLVVLQFAVTAALFMSAVVIDRQVRFLASADVGFERDHVVVIDGTEVVSGSMQTFRDRIAALPGVAAVSNAQALPGDELGEMVVSAPGDAPGREMSAAWLTVGPDYARTLGIDVLAGRDLGVGSRGDSVAVLLNESAVLQLDLKDPIGHSLSADGRTYTIVGVVEDYHYASLHRRVGPIVVFGPDPWNRARPNLNVLVRIEAGRLPYTLAALEDVWRDFVPAQPLVYSFLDADFEAHYAGERRLRILFRAFAGLSMLLACMGLIGLAAYSVHRRRKEIGIRKVLGASARRIGATLASDFLRPVGVAVAIAIPVTFAGTHRWLNTFAYRVEIELPIFVMAAALVFVVAVATIAAVVLRAANDDPVESLRYE